MKIKDFIDYEQPNKYIVESERYSNEYDIPVLTAGQSFMKNILVLFLMILQLRFITLISHLRLNLLL